MTTATPIPDIREELERKTLDELVRISSFAQEQRIEEGEFSLIAKSIWAITSGLIATDSAELVARAADQFTGPTRKAHFLKAGDVCTFAWNPEKDDYVLVKRPLGKAPVPTLVKAERDARTAIFQPAFDALAKAGWTRL
ncbi:hypothetical protein GFK26_18125 [Variovorax paradoxus]|uniref:Uncharacterized protein n=1 Tax=Variovorax paradoxus TaxID=34073 RepID=A0A5Q0M524_VARPD|nr:hypothetical protein [Variovorax paradoxus]QFZ84546.1 hypothetical protein GFK26_18125 [Variovorax paradoxus]